MTELKLSYKKVFNRYNISSSDHLAQITYSVYKKLRLLFSKANPLTENEKYMFSEKDYVSDTISDKMPLGYNYLKKENVEGVLKLDYLDIYDYLPKEDLPLFLKKVKRFASQNQVCQFSAYQNEKFFKRLENFGQYFDRSAFSNLSTIEIVRNGIAKDNSPLVTISLCNLSTTFLVVKYRFHVNKNFNDKLNEICKKDYKGNSSISRQFNVPWYKPKRFGRAFFDGNQIREKKLYELLSELKWGALQELRKYFTIRFFKDDMFPPVFETYSTNIRPNKDNVCIGFWDSVMFDRCADYSLIYNTSICWDYKSSNYEGYRLAAYCGGNYSNNDNIPEIAHNHISNEYAVYITACTLGSIAERDIAMCNKKISKTIKKANASSLLKVRVLVEKKLYYSYRFINEFSGKTIEQNDVKNFHHEFLKTGSISSRNFEGISKRVKESKEQIDNIFKLLNNAADYKSSESNIKLQWVMMIITFLSLFVALLSVFDGAIDMFDKIIKTIIELAKFII